jgi:sRNA-binding regulator protein Hfq
MIMSNKSVFSCFVLAVRLHQGMNAQQQTYPAGYVPVEGDTLDVNERDHYGFFPNVEGFQFAVFSPNPECSLQADVCFLLNGIRHRIVVTQFSSMSALQRKVDAAYHNLLQNDQAPPAGADVVLYLIDGGKLSGELLLVEDDRITLSTSEGKPVMTFCKDIRLINIKRESRVLALVGGGLLVGTLVGAAVYQIAKAKGYGLGEREGKPALVPILGADGIVAGTIAGIIWSQDKEIENPTPVSILTLRSLARYQWSNPK